jgi:hypothetical protein
MISRPQVHVRLLLVNCLPSLTAYKLWDKQLFPMLPHNFAGFRPSAEFFGQLDPYINSALNFFLPLVYLAETDILTHYDAL